mgnify:CR=1 FL=1
MTLREQELLYAYLDGLHCKIDEIERDEFTYNDLLFRHNYNSQVVSLFVRGYYDKHAN